MSNASIARLQRELRDISVQQIPQIFVQPHEDDLTHVQALIMGPPGTPYAFGFFRFDMRFPQDYPNSPPSVHITTTDGGKVRFNPNLYACGKVCLSILGTWPGESSEQWSAVQSISSVLLSIQSLLCENPFHNEPGFEKSKDHDDDVVQYNDKITHETLRVSVCSQLEEILRHTDVGSSNHNASGSSSNSSGKSDSNSKGPKQPDFYGWEYRDWNPFTDVMKREFLHRYDTYVAAIEKERSKHKDGTQFKRMPFEAAGNGIFGAYDYSSVLHRLQISKSKLQAETRRWIERGVEFTKNETYAATRLKMELDKLKHESLEGISCGPVSESNLFLWEATVFGPEDTPWEGGIYTLQLVFSDRYPDDPPRLQFTSNCKMFHPHITTDGIPLYQGCGAGPTFREFEGVSTGLTNSHKRARSIARGGDSLTDILLAVKELLRKAPSSSCTNILNPEASQLFFSDPLHKEYNRRVRRCVQQIMEG